MYNLKCQLEHYKFDVIHHDNFQNPFTINELCCRLVKTSKLQHHNNTLFSAMKHVKTAMCNKIEDEFLADFMMIYIKWDLVEDIGSDSIIDEFYYIKNQRLQLE